MRASVVVLGAVAAVAALGCAEERRIQQGTAVVGSKARQLWVAPNTEFVATLADVTPSSEPNAPADVFVGALTIAPASSGPARRLGGGVTNLPGSLVFSADSRHLAFLGGFSVARAKGELRLARTDAGEPEALADSVTFYAFTRDGRSILWVANNELFRRAVAGGEAERLLGDVAQFEVGPAGRASDGWLLVKRPVSAGRELLLLELATKTAVPLARGVGLYGFSPDGERFGFVGEKLVHEGRAQTQDEAGLYVGIVGQPLRRVAEAATEFKFSPATDRLAYLAPPSGKAVVGDLYVSDGAQAPRKIANRVQQTLFAQDGSLGLLASYETQAAAGTLGILPPAGPVIEVARNVKQFSFTPKGRQLLFSQAEFRNGAFTLLLGAFPVQGGAEAKARVVDQGVYGYAVDPAEKLLAYKHRCASDGRSCELSVADLASAAAPRRLLSGAAAFEFVPDGSGLVVVTTRRAGKNTARLLYSLGVISATEPGAKLRVLDDDTTGEFELLGREGARVAFLVEEPKRPGLYIGERSAAVPANAD
jgi:hypothetical protein